MNLPSVLIFASMPLALCLQSSGQEIRQHPVAPLQGFTHGAGNKYVHDFDTLQSSGTNFTGESYRHDPEAVDNFDSDGNKYEKPITNGTCTENLQAIEELQLIDTDGTNFRWDTVSAQHVDREGEDVKYPQVSVAPQPVLKVVAGAKDRQESEAPQRTYTDGTTASYHKIPDLELLLPVEIDAADLKNHQDFEWIQTAGTSGTGARIRRSAIRGNQHGQASRKRGIERFRFRASRVGKRRMAVLSLRPYEERDKRNSMLSSIKIESTGKTHQDKQHRKAYPNEEIVKNFNENSPNKTNSFSAVFDQKAIQTPKSLSKPLSESHSKRMDLEQKLTNLRMTLVDLEESLIAAQDNTDKLLHHDHQYKNDNTTTNIINNISKNTNDDNTDNGYNRYQIVGIDNGIRRQIKPNTGEGNGNDKNGNYSKKEKNKNKNETKKKKKRTSRFVIRGPKIKLLGEDACQYKTLRKCARKTHMSTKKSQLESKSGRKCNQRSSFLECVERRRVRRKCRSTSITRGNLPRLRSFIKKFFWNGDSCVLIDSY